MKALRLSEEEYAAVSKRLVRTQHGSGWPLPPLPPKNKNDDPATHKYHAKRTHGYDSTLEAKRARELALLERAGEIENLREQVPFLLIDEQRDQATGELIEHACTLIADFVYEQAGELVVEDCKGMRTGTAYALFVIKRKLLLLRHGIRVRELCRET